MDRDILKTVVRNARFGGRFLHHQPNQLPIPAKHLRMSEKRRPHLAHIHRLPIPTHTKPPAVDFKRQPVGSHPTTFRREQEYYSFFHTHRLASISSRYARHIIRKNIGSALFVKQFRNKRQSTQEVDQNVHISRFLEFRRKFTTTFCHVLTKIKKSEAVCKKFSRPSSKEHQRSIKGASKDLPRVAKT